MSAPTGGTRTKEYVPTVDRLKELTVVPDLNVTFDRMAHALAAEAFTMLFSADLECEHGNVPGTQPPRCDCTWERS